MKLAFRIIFLGVALAILPPSNQVPACSPGPLPARSAMQVFGKYCSSCHGRDGQAKTVKARFNHARNIADPAWQNEVTDERIFNSIMNGRSVRGKMPAFNKKITEQEADSLVTYIRGLKK
ncbi:MAG TPA: cytochrome c [Pyrinomonadaceae bacterium]